MTADVLFFLFHSSISIKDYRRTLLQTKKAQNQFRLDTKKNRSEREAEEARKAVAAEVAAQEQENLEREVMERRMELQEDMLINLNHKFPDETSAIEFHLTGVRCVPDHGIGHWQDGKKGRCGLILDVKGIHLYVPLGLGLGLGLG